MTATVLPSLPEVTYAPVVAGGIKKQLETTGRLPPVTLLITPLEPNSTPVQLNRFLSYHFSSSMLIPVESFSFNFVAPDDTTPMNRLIKEGDMITLYGNGQALSTGIIDTTDIENEASFGEKGQIQGRNLMSQLEDNQMTGLNSATIWGQRVPVASVLSEVTKNTRIQATKFVFQDAPQGNYLFATNPGESRLTALQRYIEPLNCLAWVNPVGNIVVGRPNMAQDNKGILRLSKSKRDSNVIGMKATRSSATIPNFIIPVWSAQEDVADKLVSQGFKNNAEGPKRLFSLGHILSKTVVTSLPSGNDPQSLAEINQLKLGADNLLNAMAKREMARQNYKELLVQCRVPGHYNELGEPYLIDTVYKIEYDRGDVDEEMYLYQVDYTLDGDNGQTTTLYFCRKGTIVSDVRFQ